MLQTPVQLDVTIPASHTVWYANPVWLIVGAGVILLFIVLAIMARRRDSGTTTTVIR